MIQLNKNGVDLMSFVSKRVGGGGIKVVSVGQKLANGLSSGFRRDPGGVESSQMEDLHEITQLVELTTKPYCWVWSLNPSVNILAWRLALDKLSTLLTMSLRGLELPSIHCPVCQLYILRLIKIGFVG
ncbi:hypothetical protein Tco_0672485 [Tanacetum coccineum]